jgi:hypothetical protein
MALCSFKNDSLILSIDCSFMLFTSYISLFFVLGFRVLLNKQTKQTFREDKLSLRQLKKKKRVRKKLLDCRNVNKLESRFRRGKPVPRPQSKQASTGIKTEIYSLYKMKIEKLIISKLILSHQETTNNHYVALCEEVRELMSF